MKALDLAGKNGNFAGERQLDRAGTQDLPAHFLRSIGRTQPALGDKQSDLPKAHSADCKLLLNRCPLNNPSTLPSQ